VKAKPTPAGADQELLLDAVAWLRADIANGREIAPPLRKALLTYKAKRDGRVHDAVLQVTVDMASDAGHPKTLEVRPGVESAFDVASRLHGTKPDTIRKRLARKRRAKGQSKR
jgi:hypothetical protein